jgi:hypothetical protein
METKDQLNQNPENVENQQQEENSKSVETTDKNVEEKSDKSEKEMEKSEKNEKVEEKASKKPTTLKTVKKTKEKVEVEEKAPEEGEMKEKAEVEDKAPEEKKKKAKTEDVKAGEEVAGEEKVVKPSDEKTETADKQEELVKEPGKKKEKAVVEDKDEDQDIHSDDEDDEDDEEHEDVVEDYDGKTREELVAILEETVVDEDVIKIKKKIALIKVAYHKISKEEQNKKPDVVAEGDGEDAAEEPEKVVDEVEKRYNTAFAIYRTNRKKFLEEQEKLKQQNLDAKKVILEELKTLIDSEESLKKTYDEFKTLQEKWREIGMVPKSEVNNLWQNYHFYVEKFFDKVKMNKELRDLDMKKNLEAKINLCEKAEELLLETSILKSFKELQTLHHKWKEVGPVPQDKNDEIWERFKATTEKINELRREHYNKLQDDQKNNLLAKNALCEKAEEILNVEQNTIKEWQTATDKISELLKVWKTIGRAPRKNNDEVWDRFKASLDTFFSNKKEFFQKIKEEQVNNYNLKLDICAQAESMMDSSDWRKTTHDLINLQKEWKAIGPVPRKHSDKIWKRFRLACDTFFNRKSDFFTNIDKHEADNKKLKEELIKKVENCVPGNDKNENLNSIKEFQREWTGIGHVPMKDKEHLQSEFRKAINKLLDKLKISQAEIQTINYKQRFENIDNNPDKRRILNNERHFLVNKCKKLEDEINLWENNLGFFAASKKASLLKQEFESKIEKAKADVALLKAKIRFLDSDLG